jgi:hypothetical protein
MGAGSVPSSSTSSTVLQTVSASGAMASRILWAVVSGGGQKSRIHVPPYRAQEVEVDNETPSQAFCPKLGWFVEELELCGSS